MKETQTATAWKPGRAGINGPLNTVTIEFVRDAFRDIATAYAECDTPEEMLQTLENEYGFAHDEATDTRGTKYQNAIKQTPSRAGNVIRISASLSSKGDLSWQVKEFYQ
jgi:hypothetical protein